MKILLISPRTPHTFWSFSHVMPFIAKKAAFPPLGLVTVAAMLPREWSLRLVDLNVESLSDSQIAWADYVFLTGMIIHEESVRNVVRRCKLKGKPVIGGGPLFTTGHERFSEVDHFVLGEAECLVDELVADLAKGTLKPQYFSAEKPDLTTTPVPRWDLLDMKQYARMSVQFSRGCPFNCDFCDIIVMYGRVPRSKPPAQLIDELEALKAAGWDGSVFIVDDNFIGNRVRAKELLRALIEWRARRRVKWTFLTEASLNLVDDPELLNLMVRAGFTSVFVGIESPEEDSLAECSKTQNRRRDLVEAVRTIQKAGLEVMGGFIVGFDNDKPGIFEQQLKFIREAGVVTAMVGLLTALPETRLFKRLKSEGRILAHSTGNNLDAVLNYVPTMNRQMLIDGYRRLVQQLYSPQEYYDRILVFLRNYKPSKPAVRLRWQEIRAFVRSMWVMGLVQRGRRQYWKFMVRALVAHPRAFSLAAQLAITGYHFRRIAGDL
ncbi:MAG: B12-binding domain-containing radical SAM protein [Phycisphaerales bacterium]|nr:B12-binding domain-containing radical SAM protein [Phycisphaerales bacterium]MCB9854877.1 B12-binding domain-containing radical SAM protein [Phycisphaerales bacterium]MCB9865001.1 B12-binding domain-containing radical SAM protein [Phycisphaerales bacterium]